VAAVRHAGIEEAAPTPEALDAIAAADLVVLAPSNPFVSIGTILAVPGMRAALLAAEAPTIAVSPIVGGAALRGPADRMLQTIEGREASAAGIVAHYRARHPGLVDTFVIDERDGASVPDIAAGGMERIVTLDTVMSDHAARQRLGDEVLAAALPGR
jgi:LPPG:FO 2-phospho-L-lactate transferase